MSRSCQIIILAAVLLLLPEKLLSYQQSRITGTVRDSAGVALPGVAVSIPELKSGTYTDSDGKFSIDIPPDRKQLVIEFSSVGFRSERRNIIHGTSPLIIEVTLYEDVSAIREVTVTGEKPRRDISLTRLPVNELRFFPSVSGGIEAAIKTLPGISSNNELSSQYSVRGGNYDENLVYVNDNEVFKPFLIRSGQQEGLSYINSDLVSSVNFSSGGFRSSYGDKMSSVLDITYRTPERSRGSVSLGLLLSSAHLEGISKNGKFTWIAGLRYRSTRMMLNTLDSEGDYKPVFADLQSCFTWKTGQNSLLSVLASYSSNIYNFRPQSRSSTFGTEAIAYQLYVLFEGAEKDRYQTFNANISWDLSPRSGVNHKFQLSEYITGEAETFDIRGYYSMSSLDKESGSENFTDTIMNIGIGSFLSHARNRLSAFIQSAGYRGYYDAGEARIEWGARIRHNLINDQIREWTRVDSAGYSLPYGTEELEMTELVSASNRLSNILAESFIDAEKTLRMGVNELVVYGGARGTYCSLTNELLISPRTSARLRIGNQLSVRIAAGIYYQPPFYREMRYPDGSLNGSIKSQKSVHAVAGSVYDFRAWGRPFRFTAEIYNKWLRNIVPYKVDNVRVVYSGENSAEGFARGLDLRLTGEFVEDAESWISMSLMSSRLRIPGEIEDYFPSPFDQTFSCNIFFQDYLPANPTWRAHINITYATGLPIVSPFNDRYDQYHRLPDYRRVDLGITKVIKGKGSLNTGKGFKGLFEEVIAGLEVFNLLDINNTVSYYWVKTINNLTGRSRQFAVPNYLTGRSLNIRVIATF